jgi:hypothetical protein
LDFLPQKPVVVEVSKARLSSDAGLLPIRQFDEQIRFTERFAAALQDLRDPVFTQHSLRSMVRQRIYGILADYVERLTANGSTRTRTITTPCDPIPFSS